MRVHTPLMTPVLLAVCASLSTPRTACAFDYVPDQIICKIANDYSIDEVNDWYGTVVLEWIPGTRLYLLGIEGIEDMEGYADVMEAGDLIESADPNYHAYSPEAARQMPLAAVGGTVADFEDQDAASRVALAAAHEVTLGEGATVAIVDTGVDFAHPRLSGQLLVGYDFIDHDTDASEEQNGADEDGDGTIDDGYGHGTMVAGVVSLVAPAATILPVRVLGDEGMGNAWDAIEGIRYAADAGVNVMNLSFGTPAEIPLLSDEVARAENMGIVVVAAAGNQSSDAQPYYPAAHEKAMMITALDSLDVKAVFADWHALVDASAPGTGIRSTYPGGGWALGSGCSFAAPFVSGEAALVASTLPFPDKATIVERVRAAVDDVYTLPGNAPFVDQLGTGRVNIGAAVTVVAVGTPPVRPGELRLFPNPSPGSVHLDLEAEVRSQDARVHVYTTSGRLVRVLALTGRGVIWDGRDARGHRAASGVYHLRARDGARVLEATVQILR